MSITTLVLGGARSGKSAYAEQQALESGKTVLYVATATAEDEEMAARIASHRAARPADWRTLEAPLHTGQSIRQHYQGEAVIVLDCITLLASNVLMGLAEPFDAGVYQEVLDAEVEGLAQAMGALKAGAWWIVSNEAGLGVVPEYTLGRLYRDGLGRMNQRLAQICEHVIFMAAGLPLQLK
ncbi:MAG: bifunctional adenosylcobinamide kinase/adenosylcobinamide-phosphate guanylyltransferase [Anaerolineaceae bacterium]|nr:bifunctional adenosylcobinamide kinase/adenosylcobinamide-phosphate guanylyltransferase [Anaerolineaceae bacterium]